MQEENQRVSYVRTLVYTITAAVLSIVLFGLMFLEGARTWFLSIIIIEIGIFAIIFYCIFTIVNWEKKMEQLRDPKNYVIKFDNCPDYYVKRYDTATKGYFCSNEYVVTDKRNPTKVLIMKLFAEEDKSSPATHNADFMEKNGTGPAVKPKPIDKFMMEDIMSKVQTLNERCQIVNPNVPESSTDKLTGYKTIPWVSVQRRCDTLYSKN